MKKYLINIEGHNGDPNGEYHYHFKANESNLKEKLEEELSENCSKYEEEIEKSSIEQFIQNVIDNNGYYFENYGYGIEYDLTIEEL